MTDATGIIVVGPKTRRTVGPVVVIAEEIERLPPMLRAADRLAAAIGSDVRLVLAGADRDHLAWLEGQARLFLVGRPGVKLEAVEFARAEPAITERLRRVPAGLRLPSSAVSSPPPTATFGRCSPRSSARCSWFASLKHEQLIRSDSPPQRVPGSRGSAAAIGIPG